MKFRSLFIAFLSAFALAPAAHAVVVVGGDNGWEVSFDGNVHGFYVYSDRDAAPAATRSLSVDPASGVLSTAAGAVTVNQAVSRSGGGIGGAGDSTSRIRTGLLPAFFSVNVRSPEVNGLTGSARISFAPQIQNGKTKNNFGNGTQAGAQIDMREVFFNVDGDFGTVSVGRTLSLFQRHNLLTDMTLFGVGAEGGSDGGGTSLGRIGYGYVYPQFNARISYKTPDLQGFQVEVGLYDPSKIAGSGVSASETDSPRWEAEATFSTTFDQGGLKFFLSGMFQNAERSASGTTTALDVDANGVAGGVVADFAGFQFVASGYTGEALGTLLMLDTDSLDAMGTERDNDGYIIQASYTFNGTTKFGISYGASMADETTNDTTRRNAACGNADTNYAAGGTCVGAGTAGATTSVVSIEERNAFTVGAYHDVTSWFKVVAEYSKVEDEWFDGVSREADVISAGAFFLW